MRNPFARLAIILPLLWISFHIHAQLLSVGSSGDLNILPGTTFAVDQLVMIPSTSYTISNNTISVQNAAPITKGRSIAKTYQFERLPLPFTGKIGISYQEKELNGIDENNLRLLIYNTQTWNTISINNASIQNNLAESKTIPAIITKSITLGDPEYKGDFEILSNPAADQMLNVWIYKEGFFSIHSLDGKLFLRKYLTKGIQQLEMSASPSSTYIFSSNNRSEKFIR